MRRLLPLSFSNRLFPFLFSSWRRCRRQMRREGARRADEEVASILCVIARKMGKANAEASEAISSIELLLE
jgi:hypothetical protein